MFVLLPYQHDRMSVKRLPWVSIAILAVNLLAFLVTLLPAGEARKHEEAALDRVLAYWAANPFVKTTPAFDERYPKPASSLRRLVSSTFDPPDAADLARQQEEFERLIGEAIAASETSPLAHWGFVPANPGIGAAVTSQFLHAGWLHLLGNMLFFALSAPFIENRWGRVFFPLFYLAGGAAAAWAQALRFPESTVPLVGASGAIAAVMGAFLVCLGRTRIQFFYAWVVVGVRWGTFPAPAWLMLPLWLLSQLVSASAAGDSVGVAYWAHVGGFVFGAAVAGALRASGLEARFLLAAVDQATSAYGDPRLDRAAELREGGSLPEAMAAYEAVLATSPASAAAHGGAFDTALLQGETAAAARHAAPMLEGLLKSGETVMALERHAQVRERLPDLVLPARLLYAVAVAQEQAAGIDAAVETVRRLAAQHPADPFTLKALLHGAGAAAAAGNAGIVRELLAIARAHPLATGEWAERIARIAATSAPRTGAS